jgi:MFS family permease
MAATTHAGRVTPKEIFARFGAVGIALICVQLDYFALALALPGMAEELNTTTTDLQWTVSAYMIAIGIAMIPGSRIADLVGRKKILLIGLSIFGLASLWVGLSPTTGSVIAARVLQGLGAGLYFPVAMSLVANATHALERPRILGFLSGLAGIGTAAGPIIGGGFASTIGWRWVFLINVPIAAIGVIWGMRQLKESKDSELAGKSMRNLDWLGVLLIAVGIGGVSLGIDDVSIAGMVPITYIPAILGIAAIVAFSFWERRAAWPLTPPVLMKNRNFTALVVASTIANMGICVMIFVSTLYLQQVRGYSGLAAGLMFIPAAIGLSIGGPISGRLASRVPGQRVMTVAMLVGALSLALLAVSGNIAIFLVVMAFSSFSLGMGYQFGNIAVQSVVPEQQSGAAAGVLLTLMVALGGVAVVVASATMEAVGGAAGITQSAISITLYSWAALVGILGTIFGLTQWKNAKVPVDAASGSVA